MDYLNLWYTLQILKNCLYIKYNLKGMFLFSVWSVDIFNPSKTMLYFKACTVTGTEAGFCPILPIVKII